MLREYYFVSFAGLELFVGRDLSIDATYPKIQYIRERDGFTARLFQLLIVGSRQQS